MRTLDTDSLVLCSGTVRDASLVETVRAASAAGFDGVSLYHREGADLIMTHYCALGNQPRMKADPRSPSNQIHFLFAGGTNLDPAKDKHMHEGTLTFVDDDHIEFSGVAWENGKPSETHCGTMKLVRKK